ncbi:MAG: hypothetical protein IKO22_02790 [Oscillospiraceae bacterium]|nr:hypothetical protein [Oscillospiraceae bacterium]
MSKQENRVLVEHPKTGMMVSVPESKQNSLGKGKELSPEAKAKFERAYRKAVAKIYGR